MPAPDTARSLKRWWEDGGEDWLTSYLELPRLGPVEALKRHVVVPPDARQTLHLDAGPEFLRPLLCPLGDAACGADTRGWRARAETFLENHRLSEWSREAKGPFGDRSDAAARDCDVKASADKSPGRYRRWRSCIDGRRDRRWALPLGDMKAPDTGWLLVSGRRGHYDFCDAIGAYDLATGTAYVRESCSGLALVEGGHVDEAATARSARSRGRVGRLRIENLREAAWALLMMTRAEKLQTHGEYLPAASRRDSGLRGERRRPWRRHVRLVVDYDGADTHGLAVDSRRSRTGRRRVDLAEFCERRGGTRRQAPGYRGNILRRSVSGGPSTAGGIASRSGSGNTSAVQGARRGVSGMEGRAALRNSQAGSCPAVRF